MDLELGYRPSTGLVVTAELFGGNTLYTHNAVGAGTTYDDALDQIGLTGLRYPGGAMTEQWGEAFYDDPNTPPASAEGAHTFVGLDAFLAYASAEGRAVTIVLPTSHLFEGEAEGAAQRALRDDAVAKVGAFVRDLLAAHHEVDFAGFEIGNEYWNHTTWMTSKEYGILANAVAIEVQAAMDAVLGKDAGQPAILMQMGDPWGRDFDVGDYAGTTMTWQQQIAQANADVLAGMTDAARDAVDGVIEHYYFTETGPALTLGDNPAEFADRSYREIAADLAQFRAAWDEAAHGALSLAITEWGLDHRATTQLGLPSAAVALEMFEGLLRLGAGLAHAWPVEIRGPTDLAGRHDGGDGDNEGKLTPIGEAVRLMAAHTIGLELIDNGFDAEDRLVENVEVNAFGSDERFVVFISSRSDIPQDITLDVSAQVADFASMSGTRLMLDDPAAPWNQPWRFATTEALDGAELGNSTDISVTLGAWEVVMVEFVLPDLTLREADLASVNLIAGHASDDRLKGTGDSDRMLGRAGSDLITGHAGEDRLAGNTGHDRLLGGRADDVLFGGFGHDRLQGGSGDDTLFGGAGNDRLFAGPGNDVLTGGGGADVFVFSGAGFNTVTDFGRGDDSIDLRATGQSLGTLTITSATYMVDGVMQVGTLVDYGAGAIFLIGTDPDGLGPGDFLL